MKNPVLLRALLLAAFLLPAGVFAQNAPPPGSLDAPSFTPPLPPSAPSPAATERTIYVPFDKLDQVFENQGRGVFLPYREFLEMWNRLNLPEQIKKNEPPVEGVAASAAYQGKVEGDVATIEAKLNFEALKEGWSKLAIGAPTLSIATAKSEALLSRRDEGYELLFPKKGSYPLEATIYGRLVHEPGATSLTLDLPKTSASQFELTLPEKGLEFTITPASAYTATENPDGSTKLLAYFGGSGAVKISWTRRASETALQPLLFADVTTKVQIGAGAVRTTADLHYRLLRAGVDFLDILVPENEQVLTVEGEDIREWTVQAPAGQPQRVHIALHKPAHDIYVAKLQLERALGALPQKAPLPLIQAAGVERQTGSIAVSADPELVAEAGELKELTQQAGAAESPAAEGKAAEPQGRLVGQYRYLRLPYAGVVNISEASPQVLVKSYTLASVGLDRLTVVANFDYEVKKAGIFSTQIELPAGFSQADAKGEGIESAVVEKIGERQVLNIKFTGKRLGQIDFRVECDSSREKPDAPLASPIFSVRGAERHEATIGLAIHVSLKANTVDRGDLREEDINKIPALPEAPTSAPGAVSIPGLTDGEADASTPLTLAFSYRTGATRPAQLQFELRKPRVSAAVLAMLNVRESLLIHVWTIKYAVDFAGVGEFSVAVPAAIANDVQIGGAKIKERTRSEEKDDRGKPTGAVIWKVTLQDKVLGGYELTLTHEAPRGEQQPGATTTVALQEIRPLNVFRESGQVAVIKEGSLELTKSQPSGLESIDPKELDPSLQTNDVFLAYKYSAHPIALSLDVSKNLYLEVPTAVVTYAALTSVVAEDEAETTEVIYWVKNNAQQFLSVQLPTKGGLPARLLSDFFVNGEPQQPSRRPDRNELLVRLPISKGEGAPISVRFVYEAPALHPGQRLGWSGHFTMWPPILSGIETLQSRWTLFLPADRRYTHFGGAMRPPVARHGWDEFRELFMQGFAPAEAEPEGNATAEPPELPPAKGVGFDTQLQKEGASITLRRLAAPSTIRISQEAKGYASTKESLALILALAGGLYLMRASRRDRFIYFVVVGVLTLVVAGALNPAAGGVWVSLHMGATLALFVWLLCGLWRAVVASFAKGGAPNPVVYAVVVGALTLVVVGALGLASPAARALLILGAALAVFVWVIWRVLSAWLEKSKAPDPASGWTNVAPRPVPATPPTPPTPAVPPLSPPVDPPPSAPNNPPPSDKP